MSAKHLLLIGTAGLDDLLVKELAQGRLTSLRYYRGTLLIEKLLDRIRQHGEAIDREHLSLSIEVPAFVSSATCLAERDGSRAIVGTRELGRHAPRLWPASKAQPEERVADFQIVFDVEATYTERSMWINAMQRITASGWTIIHSHDKNWVRKTGEQLPPERRSRTILVIDADDLRHDGVRISKGSSWDRSYSELLAHVACDGSVWFTAADHLLVRFGAEAVVHFHRQETGPVTIVAHHLPAAEEGAAVNSLGPRADIAIFLSRFVMELSRCALPDVDPNGERKWIDDVRTTEQRIPFATQQAMRSVLGAYRSGWVELKDEVGLPPEIFAFNAKPDDAIASINITGLPSASSLLHLATHAYPGTLDAWAMNYVRTGETGLLGAAPVVEFGALLLADRDEIEQYRDIRNKVLRYVAEPGDKPMSIGVFGPPGSGKTFGVKEIKDSLGDAVTWLLVDISGSVKEEQILKEWRGIRDENLRGRIPFVLFDEFDSPLHGAPYGWFQHFLRPVNEGLFREDAADHPIGRGIFVFTGGTCHSYAEFRLKCRGGDPVDRATETLARERKMPDMARRLEDHIDVKGISTVPGEPDHLFIVRRAIVMRKQFTGKKAEDRMKRVDIDLDLLAALLHLPEYSNGTSSMCKLLATLTPMPDGRITKAALPEASKLTNYLDPAKFTPLMNHNDHLQDVIEPLAKMIHEHWRAEQDPAEHKEADVSWEELPQSYRDSNRMQAMDMVRKLTTMGYRCEAGKTSGPVVSFTDDEVERMGRMEHDRWMKEKMAAGWTYGPDRNNALKIHPLLVPYDQLDEKAKNMDRDPVRMIPEWLGKVGFGVVKAVDPD